MQGTIILFPSKIYLLSPTFLTALRRKKVFPHQIAIFSGSFGAKLTVIPRPGGVEGFRTKAIVWEEGPIWSGEKKGWQGEGSPRCGNWDKKARTGN